MNIPFINKSNVKNVVVFCVKESNSYDFLKATSIKLDSTSIRYGKDKTFPIDLENPTYRKKNTKYFCIDINVGQIYFQSLKQEDFMSPRMFKMLLTDNIIEQLAKATSEEPKKKFDYVSLFIGILIGAMGGLLAGVLIGLYLPFGAIV